MKYLYKILSDKCMVILVLVSTFALTTNAQDPFGSTFANITINGIWNGTPLTANSNNLIATLHYETGEVWLKLDKSTLKTGVEDFDKKLETIESDFIEFSGYIDVQYIRSKEHPIQDFNVCGNLNHFPHSSDITGKGRIEQVFGAAYSSLLRMTFELDLEKLNLGFDFTTFGIDNILKIEIIQVMSDIEQ